MKNTQGKIDRRLSRGARGFSLIELLVAMLVFVVIAGGAVELIRAHVPLFATAQSQSGMNLNLQNAVGQMQIDVSNAGSNYYTLWNQYDTPVGMTVFNCATLATTSAATAGCPAVTSTSNCYTSDHNVYGQDCFDTMNLFVIDPVSPGQIQASSTQTCSSPSTTNCVDVSVSNTVSINPPPGSTVTPAALAADYQAGDQILLIHMSTSGDDVSSYNYYTTSQVVSSTANATGTTLQIQQTASGGLPSKQIYDPYYITSQQPTTAYPNRITSKFQYPTDWVLRISQTITYSVNASNSSDPQLTRTVNAGNPVSPGTAAVVADQVIGFKIGAMAFNSGFATPDYLFNASAQTPTEGCSSNCGYDNLWPLIRSVMVSVITRSSANPASPFRNTFDGGPYQVQAVSVVMNPRNLSMRDNCYTNPCPTNLE